MLNMEEIIVKHYQSLKGNDISADEKEYMKLEQMTKEG